tara:strand:+ start:7678 stop:8397 length:720 start_codon:yes stop_codon:yes gene_type:complete
MKRLLLITAFASSIAFANAQSCTPDNTIVSPGVYPEQLDTAFADQAYDFSFQVLALKDTVVLFAGQTINATIDSIKVIDVIGIPAGFDYTCNPANCIFTWKAVGCVNLRGNPTQSQVGVYDLKIATIVYAKAGILALPVPDTTDGYELVIKGDGSASVFDVSNTLLNIYPNPSSDGTFMLSSTNQMSILNVIDIQGRKVAFEESLSQNTLILNLANAPKGIYYLLAEVNGTLISKKLVK